MIYKSTTFLRRTREVATMSMNYVRKKEPVQEVGQKEPPFLVVPKEVLSEEEFVEADRTVDFCLDMLQAHTTRPEKGKRREKKEGLWISQGILREDFPFKFSDTARGYLKDLYLQALSMQKEYSLPVKNLPEMVFFQYLTAIYHWEGYLNLKFNPQDMALVFKIFNFQDLRSYFETSTFMHYGEAFMEKFSVYNNRCIREVSGVMDTLSRKKAVSFKDGKEINVPMGNFDRQEYMAMLNDYFNALSLSIYHYFFYPKWKEEGVRESLDKSYFPVIVDLFGRICNMHVEALNNTNYKKQVFPSSPSVTFLKNLTSVMPISETVPAKQEEQNPVFKRLLSFLNTIGQESVFQLHYPYLYSIIHDVQKEINNDATFDFRLKTFSGLTPEKLGLKELDNLEDENKNIYLQNNHDEIRKFSFSAFALLQLAYLKEDFTKFLDFLSLLKENGIDSALKRFFFALLYAPTYNKYGSVNWLKLDIDEKAWGKLEARPKNMDSLFQKIARYLREQRPLEELPAVRAAILKLLNISDERFKEILQPNNLPIFFAQLENQSSLDHSLQNGKTLENGKAKKKKKEREVPQEVYTKKEFLSAFKNLLLQIKDFNGVRVVCDYEKILRIAFYNRRADTRYQITLSVLKDSGILENYRIPVSQKAFIKGYPENSYHEEKSGKRFWTFLEMNLRSYLGTKLQGEELDAKVQELMPLISSGKAYFDLTMLFRHKFTNEFGVEVDIPIELKLVPTEVQEVIGSLKPIYKSGGNAKNILFFPEAKKIA